MDLYKDLGGGDALKNFVLNFNEAYEKVKATNEKKVETGKLFNLALDMIKASNQLTIKANPEVQKKIKYTYKFKEFINKYKRVFPIYTVFDEFEMKDKNNFALFVTQLQKMADKIDTIFKKVKNFDMLNHSSFAYNEEIPDIMIDHASDF